MLSVLVRLGCLARMIVKSSTALRPINFHFGLKACQKLVKLLFAHLVASKLANGHGLIVKSDKRLKFFSLGKSWMQEEAHRVKIVSLTQEVWLSAEANIFDVLDELIFAIARKCDELLHLLVES